MTQQKTTIQIMALIVPLTFCLTTYTDSPTARRAKPSKYRVGNKRFAAKEPATDYKEQNEQEFTPENQETTDEFKTAVQPQVTEEPAQPHATIIENKQKPNWCRENSTECMTYIGLVSLATGLTTGLLFFTIVQALQ